MQEKRYDTQKRYDTNEQTQTNDSYGGFGFYSVDNAYPYEQMQRQPRRRTSLSGFGYTDFSDAFEDLHSLDAFDMGVKIPRRAAREDTDTGRLRKSLVPFDAALSDAEAERAQFASVHSALTLAQRGLDAIPSNLQVMNDMLGIGEITADSQQIPEIDSVLAQARPERAKNKRHGKSAALRQKITQTLGLRAKTRTKARVKAKHVVPAVSCAAAVLVGFVALWGFGVFDPSFRYVQAKEVYVNGIAVGAVADGDDMQSIIDGIYSELSEEYGVEVLDDQLLEMKNARVDRRYLSAAEEVGEQIRRNLDAQVSASVIYIDGMAAAAFASEEDAQWVLEQLQEPYASAQNATEVGFVQNVEIKQSDVSGSLLMDREEGYAFLLSGVSSDNVYTVAKGDTLESIALAKGLTTQELLAANADTITSADQLAEGMQLNLTQPCSVIEVGSKQIVSYAEAVAYGTEYTKDSSMYVGQSRVSQAGVAGEKQVTVEIYYIGGQEVSRTVLNETVTREPVNQVVAQGTKQYGILVSGVSSYGFMTPTTGTLTSPFGQRWGRLHSGIDIGNSTGTPLRASMSGTVTMADWNGGYGKVVMIDHGNGYTTVYAHCSQILVSSGQSVSQGEVIALMGSTGNSTGSHLHFEIRVGGVAKDPLIYLP